MKGLPHRVLCGKCDAVLCEGQDVKPPYEIIASYNGKCPNCTKKLSHLPLKIQINSFPFKGSVEGLTHEARVMKWSLSSCSHGTS